MAGKTGWFAGIATRIVFVLGIAYVSLWWSYQHFYGVFAVSPDDVGLAPSGGGLGDAFVAVLRLGLWLSIALIALGLLPVLCVGLALYAIEHPKTPIPARRGAVRAAHNWTVTVASDRKAGGIRLVRLMPRWASTRSTKAKIVGAAILALGVLTGIFFANSFFVNRIYGGAVVGLVVLTTPALWLFTNPIRDAAVGSGASGFAPRWWSERQSLLLRTSDLFLILAVIGVLFIDLPDDAHKVARTLLKNAGTVKECKVPGIGAPIGAFRLDLLSVHAVPAQIAAAGLPTGMPRTPFEGIYLGNANGWLVIYQKLSPTTGRVLRIPSSSGASLLVDARLANCPGVH